MENQKFEYDNKIVKLFILATIIWGVVAVLVGILIALQLAFPAFNFGIEYTSFGRMRPLHTNAVIFAFVGNAIFAGVYYSLQKLLKARMFSDVLSKSPLQGQYSNSHSFTASRFAGQKSLLCSDPRILMFCR